MSKQASKQRKSPTRVLWGEGRVEKGGRERRREK